MNLSKITTPVRQQAGKVMLSLQKNSPTLLKYAGGVGALAAFGYGCYVSYKKLPVIVEDHKTRLAEVKKDENPAPKDIAGAYAKTSLDVIRVYSGPVILMTVSVGALFKSNDILQKRNAALGAAYAALDKGYKTYRSRVVERFGEDVDRQIVTGEKTEEVEETVTDAKGKEKTVKKKMAVVDPDADASPYAKYMTKTNPYWKQGRDALDIFIKAQERYANDLFNANGFYILNDLYEALGFEKTNDGMVHGWIKNGRKNLGDNHIIIDVKEVMIPDEYGHYEWAYRLDFNVDGNIYGELV
jgi:hypothetical protein